MNFLKNTGKNTKAAVLAPASSGDRMKWVEQEDLIGRFKVVDIRNDSILLSAESTEFSIFLYEKRGQKNVAPLKKETGPVIVTVGSGGKSMPAPAKAAPAKQADLIKTIKKTITPSKSSRPGKAPTRKPN